VEILSTGGSARALREAGIAVTEVSEHTGFPEILDGRVKTLVPQIHGGILGRRDLPEHVAQMAAHGIAPIDLVAVNLYPFEATVAPAPIRPVRREHRHRRPGADPRRREKPRFRRRADRPRALCGAGRTAATGGTTLALRRRLAGEAYARTAAYDAAIAAWFAASRGTPSRRGSPSGALRQTLRYGENPHQAAAFYVTGSRPGVATARRSRARNCPTTTSTTPTPRSNASPSSRSPRW
jgi:phosphoribosylaminoimidazolecarboxamide formyltransferase/IMP cyclohydrolase